MKTKSAVTNTGIYFGKPQHIVIHNFTHQNKSFHDIYRCDNKKAAERLTIALLWKDNL